MSSNRSACSGDWTVSAAECCAAPVTQRRRSPAQHPGLSVSAGDHVNSFVYFRCKLSAAVRHGVTTIAESGS